MQDTATRIMMMPLHWPGQFDLWLFAAWPCLATLAEHQVAATILLDRFATLGTRLGIGSQPVASFTAHQQAQQCV
jgi:hypothetical protein